VHRTSGREALLSHTIKVEDGAAKRMAFATDVSTLTMYRSSVMSRKAARG